MSPRIDPFRPFSTFFVRLGGLGWVGLEGSNFGRGLQWDRPGAPWVQFASLGQCFQVWPPSTGKLVALGSMGLGGLNLGEDPRKGRPQPLWGQLATLRSGAIRGGANFFRLMIDRARPNPFCVKNVLVPLLLHGSVLGLGN